ncbi:MAG: hypothetical protein H6713_10045 [Myxococcales bacterium]|nr:hypothetical protein [Myxococcales bacterium]MCB9750328.1 hypothetical protein [Myxococcales bacterium]
MGDLALAIISIISAERGDVERLSKYVHPPDRETTLASSSAYRSERATSTHDWGHGRELLKVEVCRVVGDDGSEFIGDEQDIEVCTSYRVIKGADQRGRDIRRSVDAPLTSTPRSLVGRDALEICGHSGHV